MIFHSAFSFALITEAAQGEGFLAALAELITPILYLVVLGLCLKIRARKYEGNKATGVLSIVFLIYGRPREVLRNEVSPLLFLRRTRVFECSAIQTPQRTVL